MTKYKSAYGCIVGRYQTPYLHAGHKATIDKVMQEHENLVIFLGIQKGQPSDRNPLDFQTRKVMMHEAYPVATILPLPDNKSDTAWSATLDERLSEVIGMNTCTLYGSRDSFIPHYHGKFPVLELESPDKYVSATIIREEVIRTVKNTQDFRIGVIYGVTQRFASPYCTVDIAITRNGKLLLVQKPDESGWRFPGGFVDNGDLNFLEAIKREAGEELGKSLELSNFEYVTSRRMDDWRYRATKEKIFTTLFTAQCSWGEPQPNDDIKYAKWVPFEDLHKEQIEPEHKTLLSEFMTFLELKINKKENNNGILASCSSRPTES